MSQADALTPRDVLLIEHAAVNSERCPVCRYDLSAIPEPRCPECGEHLRLNIELVQQRRAAFITGTVLLALGLGIHLPLAGLFLLLPDTLPSDPDWPGLLAGAILLAVSAAGLILAVRFGRGTPVLEQAAWLLVILPIALGVYVALPDDQWDSRDLWMVTLLACSAAGLGYLLALWIRVRNWSRRRPAGTRWLWVAAAGLCSLVPTAVFFVTVVTH